MVSQRISPYFFFYLSFNRFDLFNYCHLKINSALFSSPRLKASQRWLLLDAPMAALRVGFLPLSHHLATVNFVSGGGALLNAAAASVQDLDPFIGIFVVVVFPSGFCFVCSWCGFDSTGNPGDFRNSWQRRLL